MDFQDLIVWQKAVDLSLIVYQLTDSFPKEETYGLISQLRRSAVSVASNIAEGEGRLTRGERKLLLSYARGSLYELQTQLVIASRRGYVPRNALNAEIIELRRTLGGYIAYVRRTSGR